MTELGDQNKIQLHMKHKALKKIDLFCKSEEKVAETWNIYNNKINNEHTKPEFQTTKIERNEEKK